MKAYKIEYKRINKENDIHENIWHEVDTTEAESSEDAIRLYLEYLIECVTDQDINIIDGETYEDDEYIYVVQATEA
ncbi:hypothetical protein [uncultured Anaerofustis sp.]|uniref:hypothetical protein n=1 Tax=uncultured Anaerofustis sp. TaxID=904996 RepID=UPI0025FE1B05|nr:hypothetical protein [uncultured Anaerofustis sp.]